MKIYTWDMLAEYMKGDAIMRLIEETETQMDMAFRVHMWHRGIEAKRLIFSDLYGDLLNKNTGGVSVLDIGGGYTSLTRLLVKNCDYTLVDFMAHDEATLMRDIEVQMGNRFWISEDWYEYQPKRKFDIIIANDIFPDVDQRLRLFIEKYLPYCRELRLSLTYYNSPRFYTTRRVDDTELLTFLSYDGRMTRSILEVFQNRVQGGWSQAIADKMLEQGESLYRNGREVMQITLMGDLSFKGTM